jgi:hypothetical protein
MQCNLQSSASVSIAPCQRSKTLQLRSKTVLWCRVRYGERVRERERRRPYCSGDAANRNSVFSHDLDLEQISLRVLGLYPLNDKNETLKSLKKLLEK